MSGWRDLTAGLNRRYKPSYRHCAANLEYSRDKCSFQPIIFLWLSRGAVNIWSIDPLEMARRIFPYGEIRLELGDYGPQAHNSEQYSELQKSNPLTEDFIGSIRGIDGVETVKTCLFYTFGVLLLSVSFGTLMGYLLCTVFRAMSVFGKVSYHFPIFGIS